MIRLVLVVGIFAVIVLLDVLLARGETARWERETTTGRTVGHPATGPVDRYPDEFRATAAAPDGGQAAQSGA